MSDNEEVQNKTILQGLNVVKESIAIAATMNKMAGGGFAGLITLLSLIGIEIINGLSHAYQCSQQEAMEKYFDFIRLNINKGKGEGN